MRNGDSVCCGGFRVEVEAKVEWVAAGDWKRLRASEGDRGAVEVDKSSFRWCAAFYGTKSQMNIL